MTGSRSQFELWQRRVCASGGLYRPSSSRRGRVGCLGRPTRCNILRERLALSRPFRTGLYSEYTSVQASIAPDQPERITSSNLAIMLDGRPTRWGRQSVSEYVQTTCESKLRHAVQIAVGVRSPGDSRVTGVPSGRAGLALVHGNRALTSELQHRIKDLADFQAGGLTARPCARARAV